MRWSLIACAVMLIAYNGMVSDTGSNSQSSNRSELPNSEGPETEIPDKGILDTEVLANVYGVLRPPEEAYMVPSGNLLQNLTFYGRSEVKATVELYDNVACGGSRRAQAVADSKGDYALSIQNLSPGTYKFSIKHTDRAGNSLCERTLAPFFGDLPSTDFVAYGYKVWPDAIDRVEINPRIFAIGSHAEMISLLPQLRAGDTVTLANGIYDGFKVVFPATLKGTKSSPIIFKALNSRSAVFTGASQLQVLGEFIQISGFKFTTNKPVPVILDGRGNQLTNSWFYRSGDNLPYHINVHITHGSLDNVVSGSLFEEITNLGVCVRGAYWNDSQPPAMRPHIHHNVFKNIPEIKNGREPIQLDQGSGGSRFAMLGIIEWNRFEGTQGDPEFISNKSSRNVIRYNTALNTGHANLTLRGGRDVQVYGNRLINTKSGIRIIGSGHKIYNNYILSSGDGTTISLAHRTAHYSGAFDNYIVHNTIISRKNSLSFSTNNELPAIDPKFPQPILAANNVIQNNIILMRYNSSNSMLYQGTPAYAEEGGRDIIKTNAINNNLVYIFNSPTDVSFNLPTLRNPTVPLNPSLWSEMKPRFTQKADLARIVGGFPILPEDICNRVLDSKCPSGQNITGNDMWPKFNPAQIGFLNGDYLPVIPSMSPAADLTLISDTNDFPFVAEDIRGKPRLAGKRAIGAFQP